MSLSNLQKQLEKKGREKFHFKINDNRSTMLSVKWEPDVTKVSLHKMFLNAPENIMNQLACYLKREHSSISRDVRAFIEDNIKQLDYSHELDRKKLDVQGNIYNLQIIYDQLNRQYFKGKLNLLITWFGKANQRNRSRVTFGLYHDQLRLIKINRLLDARTVPDYVIDFIVYHEILHHVCPSYFDDRGNHQVHSKEFKEKERQFRHYDVATDWIKKNQNKFFSHY